MVVLAPNSIAAADWVPTAKTVGSDVPLSRHHRQSIRAALAVMTVRVRLSSPRMAFAMTGGTKPRTVTARLLPTAWTAGHAAAIQQSP